MKVIGYRDVPVDTQALAEHVASTMPYVQQVFVDLNQHETPVKQLYLARKQIEQYAEREHLDYILQVYLIKRLSIKVVTFRSNQDVIPRLKQ